MYKRVVWVQTMGGAYDWFRIANPNGAWEILEQVREGDLLNVAGLGALKVVFVIHRIQKDMEGDTIEMLSLRCEEAA